MHRRSAWWASGVTRAIAGFAHRREKAGVGVEAKYSSALVAPWLRGTGVSLADTYLGGSEGDLCERDRKHPDRTVYIG